MVRSAVPPLPFAYPVPAVALLAAAAAPAAAAPPAATAAPPPTRATPSELPKVLFCGGLLKAGAALALGLWWAVVGAVVGGGGLVRSEITRALSDDGVNVVKERKS